MPELPEVETARQGIAPHIGDRRVSGVIVRQPKLRWPAPHPGILSVTPCGRWSDAPSTS